MAGETPGAANVNRRRKLNWNEDKNTNKVYASGDISALGDQSVADSVRRTSGEQPMGVPTPVLRADDKSADKYYANGASQRVRGPQVAAGQKKLGPAPQLGPAKPKQVTGRHIVIADKDQIAAALESVVDRLKGGERPVPVYIKKGENQVLKRTRAALDMLVTRERITEDEYRDVRLSYELDEAVAAVAAKLGEVVVEKTVSVDEADAVDPLAFLNSDEGDEKVDVEAVAPVAVDTSDEDDGDDYVPTPPTPAAEEPVKFNFAPGVADEPVRGKAANAVLADERVFTPDAAEVTGYPTTPKAEAEAPAEEPAAEEAKAEEPAAQTRRGKRSGRGS